MNPYERAGLTRAVKKEILDRAEKWWQTRGRHLVRPGINETQADPKVRASPVAPTVVVKHAPEKDLNDGILLGREWHDLNAGEQARVMFQYWQHIWLPEHPEVTQNLRPREMTLQ